MYIVNVDLSRHDQMVHPLSYNPKESEKKTEHDASRYLSIHRCADTNGLGTCSNDLLID